MDQSLIFNPVGALVALTFLVLVQVPIRRFAAGFRGQVTRDDFKFASPPTSRPASRSPTAT